MTSHTPGPWAYRGGAPGMTGQLLIGIELPPREGETAKRIRGVAWVALTGSVPRKGRRGSDKVLTDEDRANLCVIAYAPEMLAALKKAFLAEGAKWKPGKQPEWVTHAALAIAAADPDFEPVRKFL